MPNTFSFTPCSYIWPAMMRDMSMMSAWPEEKVVTSPLTGPTVCHRTFQPRLPSRFCLWMISVPAQPRVR